MANPRKLQVEVVTAERVVFTADDVDYVSAPGSEGQLGILPKHAALFSLLSAGELRIRTGTEEQELVVFGGFLEVLNNRVLILADSAERIEEIDVERAEAARRRAEEALASGNVIEIEMAMVALRRSRVRIRAAGRRGRRTASSTSPTGGRQ
jgi:F-type H+-transporting ATPase subunit epsilon